MYFKSSASALPVKYVILQLAFTAHAWLQCCIVIRPIDVQWNIDMCFNWFVLSVNECNYKLKVNYLHAAIGTGIVSAGRELDCIFFDSASFSFFFYQRVGLTAE